MIPEIKLDITFPYILHHPKHVSNPYRLDRNPHGSRILFYLRDNIPSNLVKPDQKFENFEGFLIKLEISKKSKWSLNHFFNPFKGCVCYIFAGPFLMSKR